MKIKLSAFLTLVLLSTLNSQVSTAFAQGNAFTYQGRLVNNGSSANGSYDLRFILFNADIGGSQTGPILTNSATPVSNGLFTVTLDFGSVFNGTSYWLDIAVRTNGVGGFTPLNPRQPLTPTPYAVFAASVGSGALAGTYANAVAFNNAANTFSGSFSGNGGGLTNLNATSVGGLSASNIWKTTGNAGTVAGANFLGTTDNQPLELKANGQRALRLEPIFTLTNFFPGGSIIWSNAPNVIGGSPVNTVIPGVVGSFIGGGGVEGYFQDIGAGYVFGSSLPNRVSANFATVSGGYSNTIQRVADGSTIGGGVVNTIQTNAYGSTIGGGNLNTIQNTANYSTIAGGVVNTISSNATGSAIGGGNGNVIRENSAYATISGGSLNRVIGNYATVPGGELNFAGGNYSFAAGRSANAFDSGAFVWADSTAGSFSSTAANQFLIRASGGVGIGTATTPPGGLRVHSGGLAVTGASSPNYGGSAGVFIEYGGTLGQIFAFDYGAFVGRSLILNGPGGSVGIGRAPTGPANAFEVEGGAGKTVAGSWAANSDARIKTDVRTVTHALEKLAQVRPVEFRYTKEYRAQHPSIEDRPYLNVIAQEFQQVFPEAVKSSGDKLPNGETILQVDTYPLTIYSAAAIQELNVRTEAQLKAKDTEIQQLKQRLEKLEQFMNELKGGAK